MLAWQSRLRSHRGGQVRFIVGKVLNHADKTDAAAITEVYDRYQYLREKRRALEAWEGLLLEIVGETKRPENVTSFPARG